MTKKTTVKYIRSSRYSFMFIQHFRLGSEIKMYMETSCPPVCNYRLKHLHNFYSVQFIKDKISLFYYNVGSKFTLF